MRGQEMKEGWEKSIFGDVCWYNRNNGVHKGTRYIGMEHIEQGTGKLLDTISSDEVLSNTFAFNKGDVLYGRLKPYLKKVIKFDISYPTITEQQSIVETLDSLKSKVDRLQENYEKISHECDALKQAILRQVFE